MGSMRFRRKLAEIKISLCCGRAFSISDATHAQAYGFERLKGELPNRFPVPSLMNSTRSAEVRSLHYPYAEEFKMLESEVGRKLKSAAKYSIGAILSGMPSSVQTKFKELNELVFWKIQLKKANGNYYNEHLPFFYTDLFDIDRAHYANKRILDIGCGPVGSLEWATDAVERVGLDPLADKYLKMNNGLHGMRYVKGYCEAIPFNDNYFDITSMLNSLDHVSDLNKSISESIRVTRLGGDIIVITEINHAPTITEPQLVTDNVYMNFPGCQLIRKKMFGINEEHNVYGSIIDNEPYAAAGGVGIICFHLRKIASS